MEEERARVEDLTQAIRNRLLALYRAGDIAGMHVPPPPSEKTAVA